MIVEALLALACVMAGCGAAQLGWQLCEWLLNNLSTPPRDQ